MGPPNTTSYFELRRYTAKAIKNVLGFPDTTAKTITTIAAVFMITPSYFCPVGLYRSGAVGDDAGKPGKFVGTAEIRGRGDTVPEGEGATG